jgi:4-hydroxybenzoate polyprenyltransferase
MIAALFAGNANVARFFQNAPINSANWVMGYVVILLGFLRMRIFDEIKDYEADLVVNPDRPLARGLIDLGEAKKVAFALAVAELLLAAAIGPDAALAWLAVTAFTMLMYREFFIGEWLRPRLELYAVMHTFVSSLMGLFIAVVVTRESLHELKIETCLFMAVNWAVFNVFEFARKTYGRDEERAGVDSYSKRLKPIGAVMLATSQILIAVGAAAYILTSAGKPTAGTWLPITWLVGSLAVGILYLILPDRFRGVMYRCMMQVFIITFYIAMAVCL